MAGLQRWSLSALAAITVLWAGASVAHARPKIPLFYQTGEDIFVAGDGSLPAELSAEPELTGAQSGYKCEILGVLWAYLSVSDCKPVVFRGDSYWDDAALSEAVAKAHPQSEMQLGLWQGYGKYPMGLALLLGLGLIAYGKLKGDEDADEAGESHAPRDPAHPAPLAMPVPPGTLPSAAPPADLLQAPPGAPAPLGGPGAPGAPLPPRAPDAPPFAVAPTAPGGPPAASALAPAGASTDGGAAHPAGEAARFRTLPSAVHAPAPSAPAPDAGARGDGGAGARGGMADPRYQADSQVPLRRFAHAVLALTLGDSGDPGHDPEPTNRDHLARTWGAPTREALMAELHRCSQGSINVAHDKLRLVRLARHGCGAGFLSEQESWDWVAHGCQALRAVYPSWEAVISDYRAGKQQWFREQVPPAEAQHTDWAIDRARHLVLPHVPFDLPL